MNVTHILADGRKTEDISGHVVKLEEAEAVYILMDEINTEKGDRHEEKEKQKK